MTVCGTCDGESFESRDGYYYCVTCGSQVQDIQEMAEETYETNAYLEITAKKGKRPRKGYERESGKPWFVHEAFQIIIKKQLEFLIQLGVDPKIKDIVGQIWFKYLRGNGIAFYGNRKGFSGIGYLRKGIIYEHNAEALAQQKKVVQKKKLKVEKDDGDVDDDDDESLELSSQIFSKECDDSEKSDHSIDDDDDDDDDIEDIVGSLCMGNIPFRRRMTLRTTLSFSYLGLLYMRVPIFLCDILRWVKEGHFPYFNASTLLPDYMKFRNQDSTIFTAEYVPKRDQVMTDINHVISLVKLKLPYQDLRKYTSRFIIDLNFPAPTHGIVNNLIKEYEEDDMFKRMINKTKFEEMAMAFIVIALKMFYGFDDSQHQAEAELARHLDPSESRDSLPSWRDWLSATRECQAKKQASGVPWSDEELRKIRDPWAYTSFCRTNIFGSWGFRDLEMLTGRNSVLGPKRKANRKEYRENCAEMFSNLTEGANTTEQPAPTPTSFPNTCRHGNSSASEDQDTCCFKDCFVRRIPLEDFTRLCPSSERGETDGGTSCRKYTLYLCLDDNGDTHHPSFTFLLDLLAKYISSSRNDLDQIIMRCEEAFFGRRWLVGGR